MNLKIGHLLDGHESKLTNTEVVEGQVIYSEGSSMQFVDYGGKRHTHGSVISGIYNDNAYTDFSDSSLSLDDINDMISENGYISSGQLIKVGNSIYQYRNIKGTHFMGVNENDNVVETGDVGYVVYLPEYVSGDTINIDFLVSVSNDTHGDKVFLVKVINNILDLTACQDLDGVFDSAVFDISVERIGNDIFAIVATAASRIKVISYSVSSSGSSVNEGFYVASASVSF